MSFHVYNHPQADRYQMIYGDCMEALPAIPDGSVDMVLCDLPYGTTKCAWDTPLPLPDLWKHYARVCRGAIVLFSQTPFDKVLGASNIAMLRYEWVWEKGHATGHLNANKAPMKAHENILVFYDRQPTYNPIKTSGHARKTATKPKAKPGIYGRENAEGLAYDSTERYPRSVQFFSSDKQRSNVHFTQKPLALCEYLIQTYSNPDDVILDNCMGSGTTVIAARNTGRRCIGIEKDKDYFVTAVKRLYDAL